MDKELKDAIGTIQHQLVLICDELYNDEDQEKKRYRKRLELNS